MLSTIIGQSTLKEQLSTMLVGGEMPHLLLCAPAEMGKRTIAMALASELFSGFQVIDTATAKTWLDVTGVLTNVCSMDAVVCTSLEALPPSAIEPVVQAISDFSLRIHVGIGPQARM